MSAGLLSRDVVVAALFLGAAAVVSGGGCERGGSAPARGEAAVAPVAGACARHGVPASRCPFCDRSLIEKLGMCGGHGVPEALCTRCNPEIIPAFKVEGDWCAEHGLPESQCLICMGERSGAAGETEPAAGGSALEALTSLGKGAPGAAADVPRWQRDPAPQCAKAEAVVRLEPDVARRAGLGHAQVRSAPLAKTIACNAQVAFDGGRYARVAARAAGVILGVERDLGDRVEAGDVLVVVESVALGSAKADLLQAVALTSLCERNHAREQALLESRVGTERAVLEAQTRLLEGRIALESARQKLRNLGLSHDAIDRVERQGDTSARLEVTAPFSGVVVDRDAVIGEAAETSRALLTIADLSTMWAWLDLYESDVAAVRPGQPVRLTVEGLPGRSFPGTVSSVSAHVDPRTRTLKVRAVVANPDGLLRAHMFGNGEITVSEPRDSVLVPKSAVQWEGCCNVVFVRQDDELYQPRHVALRDEIEGWFVVDRGVSPGQTVVTEGSFLLKTEILKGNIGAGCCEVNPGAAPRDS
jgi:cobalt-zinc-cadmium efflux system membrane fusion protein